MSLASSAVTYTSVYTDSKPRRVFWGADEELSDGGSPQVILYGYDRLPMLPVAPPSLDYVPGLDEPHTPPAPQDEDEHEPMFIQPHDPDFVPEPIYPEYIPIEDEHILSVEEQPLPPVISPTTESSGYVVESYLKEDPEEYEKDETEDGPVDYPMDGGDDEDDDDDGDSSGYDTDDEDEDDEDEEEEEEEHLALAEFAVIIPIDEFVSPPEGTEPTIPSPSTNTTTIGARITIRPQTSISLPPKAEMHSPSCITITSTTTIFISTTTCRPGRGVDYGFANTVEAEMRHRESIDCLPNEEIFTELSRMGYEKPYTKLTFYKAFFSPQWKFLIHTILQCMSAKRMSWNEFSSSMASAVICLSIGRKFNFSKYIFDSLVRNVDSSTKFYMYPRFLQLMIRAQVDDLSSHSTKYLSPALTQKVFANMRRLGKGSSRVDTPLFKGMIVAQQVDENAAKVNVDDVPAAGVADEGAASVNVDAVLTAVDKPSIPSAPPTTQPPPLSQDLPSTSQDAKISMDLLHTLLETCTTLTGRVEHLKQDKIAKSLEITKLKQRVKKLEKRNKLKVSKLRRLKRVGTSQRVDTSDDTVMDDVSKHGRIIADMDADKDVTLKDVADIAKEVALDAEIDEKPTELQEVVEVVATAKPMTEVVTVANTPIPATAPTLTTAPSAARRRNGVVIRDPEEIATPSIIIKSEAKSKDKGKGILVEEPKPLKKQAQIEQDEAFARELEAELNKIIN
nr:hypothetical protein [Tanacetum cinerariifolium]